MKRILKTIGVLFVLMVLVAGLGLGVDAVSLTWQIVVFVLCVLALAVSIYQNLD